MNLSFDCLGGFTEIAQVVGSNSCFLKGIQIILCSLSFVLLELLWIFYLLDVISLNTIQFQNS